MKLKWEKAKRNPEYFLFNFYWTLDQHDKEHPIKRLPRKEYLVRTIKILDSEDRIVIMKSRQMMLTWVVCGYCLWDAMFKIGRSVFYVSRKEDIANEMVNRNKFSYQQLRGKVPVEWIPVSSNYGDKVGAFCKLDFPQNHSEIKGLPQGSDSLRHFCASIIFSDEMAFQEQSKEIFVGSKPTLDGGGKFIGVSTANGKDGAGKFFYQVCHDIGG